VSELAFVTVLARAVLLVRPTQLRLVPAERTGLEDRRRRRRRRRQRLAGATVDRTSLSLTDTVDERRGRRWWSVGGVVDRGRDEKASESAAELLRVRGQRQSGQRHGRRWTNGHRPSQATVSDKLSQKEQQPG